MMTFRLLFHVAVTEIRLTLRSLGFWLFAGFNVFLVIVVLLSFSGEKPSIESVVSVVNNILFFQFPLLAIVVSPAVTRYRSLSREWIWATRLDYPLLLFGQLIGLTTIFLAISIIPVLMMSVWVFRAILEWMANIPSLLMFGLMFIVPVTFFELCMAFSLACWFRNSAVVIAFVTAVDVLLWLGLFTPNATLLTPLNYTLLTLRLDAVAGLGAEKPILQNLLLFYVILGMGSVLASIWGTSQLLSYGESQPWHKIFITVGMLIGLVSVVFAYWLYTLSVRQSIVPLPPSSSQVDAWEVESASHTGSVSSDKIKLESEFVLRNVSTVPLSILVLSLNTGERFVQAIISEQPALFKQNGENVDIVLPYPIKPNDTFNVKVSYEGVPILLREDYALQINAGSIAPPPSFQNPIGGYLDDDVVYLHRDGNWMAWPLSSASHISAHDFLTLEVPSRSSMIHSGREIGHTETHTTYQWEGYLPQILLATAPYYKIDESDKSIFLGRYGDKRSIDDAQIVLALVEILESKLQRPSNQHTLITLPYVQDVVFSDSIIGLPGGKTEFFPDNNSRTYHLARLVSRAWLMDKISWHGNLTQSGYLRAFETTCEMPDVSGRQKCEIVSGGNNLQAPQGRLINKTSNNPLLNALSIIFGWQVAGEITGNNALAQSEYEKWVTLAECDISAVSSPDKYRTAVWVVALYQAFNRTDIVSLIQSLVEKYPIGSKSISDDGFLQVAQTLKQDFVPPRSCDKYYIGNTP